MITSKLRFAFAMMMPRSPQEAEPFGM